MNETTIVNYIFFLKTSEALNGIYFQMANLFAQLNIVLLPVNAEGLKNIDRHKKHYIIVCRNDLQSAQIFNEIKNSYLDFALSRGHVSLYDISSFSEIENANKYQNKKLYFYFPLPVDMNQVVMNVAIDYFKTKNEIEEWPGGKRSKIPAPQVVK
jgi:hypothetical protein